MARYLQIKEDKYYGLPHLCRLAQVGSAQEPEERRLDR